MFPDLLDAYTPFSRSRLLSLLGPVIDVRGIFVISFF